MSFFPFSFSFLTSDAPIVKDMTTTSVMLSWSPPKPSTYTRYGVEVKSIGKWNDVDNELYSAEYSIPTISNPNRHQFRVIPVNNAGERGEPSSAVNYPGGKLASQVQVLFLSKCLSSPSHDTRT